MSDSKASFPDRIFFIDMLKAISIVAVVSYHSIFVPRSTYIESELPLDILFAPLRFCVPVFLTITFLLLESSTRKRQVYPVSSLLTKRLYRLAIPTLVWFGLMIFIKSFTGSTFMEIGYDVVTGEIFTGAYYLLVVFQLLFLFFGFREKLAQRNVFFAVCIFQVLVSTLIYFLLSNEDFNSLLTWLRIIRRPLVFYWIIYIAFGVFLSRNLSQITALSKRMPLSIKLILLTSLSIIFAFEYRYLYLSSSMSVPPFEYIMFTCIISIPILFLCFAAISEADVPSILEPPIHILSKYSLGIFCINGILSQVFLSFGSRFLENVHFSFFEILLVKLLGWLFLLLISLGISVLIAKINCKALVC